MKILQKILLVVSWLTVLAVLVLRLAEVPLASWLSRWAIPVMLSGAVGYLTNNIAITMLFKPFEKCSFRIRGFFGKGFIDEGRWVALVTAGLWRQGVVPANKQRIGETLAEEIPHYLLKPEEVSEHLGAGLGKVLETHPELLANIREGVSEAVMKHEEEIVSLVVPPVRSALSGMLEDAVRSGKLKELFSGMVSEWLAQEENRKMLTGVILDKVRENTPVIRELIRATAKAKIEAILEEKPMFQMVAGMFGGSEGIVAMFDWEEVDRLIVARLSDEKVQAALLEQIAQAGKEFVAWAKTPSGEERIGAMVQTLKERVSEEADSYLADGLRSMLRSAVSSEQLWGWLFGDLVPYAQTQVTAWFAGEEGRRVVGEVLDLQTRIRQAVEAMDVRQFHAMLLRVVDEHLGTIQVLGWGLGAIVGLIM